MSKTHFAVKVAFSTEFVASCGRGTRMSENVYDVSCGLCKQRSAFILAKDEADSERHRQFMMQPGRTIMEPWKHGEFMSCSCCNGNYFRTGERTCYGHYDNFHCISCGHIESRLTEVGMSF